MLYWLWLAARIQAAPYLCPALLEHFQSPEEIYRASFGALCRFPDLPASVLDSLLDKDLSQAEEIFSACQEQNIHLLPMDDPAYPPLLRQIPDPPVVLYYRGTLPDWEERPCIAMVGTRKLSAYGRSHTLRIAAEVAKGGGIVVSGLAAGADAAAMTGALTAGGTVVGVIASGLDIVYPKQNEPLYNDTVLHGCILTEYPPGTPPLRWRFPRRNRVISGLSRGIFVAEAPRGSGSLITASLAADQGRDVFALPGALGDAGFFGNMELLRSGAAPAGCGWDILCGYETLYPGKLSAVNLPAFSLPSAEKPQQPPANQPKKQEPKSPPKKKIIDNRVSTAYIDLKDRFSGLPADARQLADAVGPGESLTDDVIARSGLPAGRAIGLLTILEMKGIILRLPGKRIRLK